MESPMKKFLLTVSSFSLVFCLMLQEGHSMEEEKKSPFPTKKQKLEEEVFQKVNSYLEEEYRSTSCEPSAFTDLNFMENLVKSFCYLNQDELFDNIKNFFNYEFISQGNDILFQFSPINYSWGILY